jgi:hypothetical protein
MLFGDWHKVSKDIVFGMHDVHSITKYYTIVPFADLDTKCSSMPAKNETTIVLALSL